MQAIRTYSVTLSKQEIIAAIKSHYREVSSLEVSGIPQDMASVTMTSDASSITLSYKHFSK
jgi:hypothetical protein